MKKLFAWFAFIQVLGVVLVSVWERTPLASIGFSMWIASIVLLFPGDMIAQTMAEHFFWMKGIPLSTLQWYSVLLGVIVNAITWFGLAYLFAGLSRRRVAAQ